METHTQRLNKPLKFFLLDEDQLIWSKFNELQTKWSQGYGLDRKKFDQCNKGDFKRHSIHFSHAVQKQILEAKTTKESSVHDGMQIKCLDRILNSAYGCKISKAL